MRNGIPRVHNGVLIYFEESLKQTISLDEQIWHRWIKDLETTFFCFMHHYGLFTVRKERKKAKIYWYLYLKRHGHLFKAYLGKSESLTKSRLYDVGSRLWQQSNADEKRSSPSLPTAKFMLPYNPAELVSRGRLLHCLDIVMQRSLVLLSAPAGYGKSALLSNWYATAQEKNIAVAYLALDEDDNDPSRFRHSLEAALQTLCLHNRYDASSMIDETDLQENSTSIFSCIEKYAALSHKDFVLIIDNYHVITESAIHRALEYVLHYLPSSMHLILATRSNPPIPLARLRAHRQLREISMGDLCFSHEEAQLFFSHCLHLHLSPESIAMLLRETEGWIVALQLVGNSLQGNETPDQISYALVKNQAIITDYYLEEVYNLLPEKLQHFVLSTSILHRLSVALCDTMLNDTHSHRILKQLEHFQLCIPTDTTETIGWYRYPRLLKTALRGLLETDQALTTTLHIRAAQWYEHHGILDEALYHLLASNHLAEAGQLIERHGVLLIKEGKASTVLQWLRMLPDTFIHSQPFLCLLYVQSLCLEGHIQQCSIYIKSVERFLASPEYQQLLLASSPNFFTSHDLHAIQCGYYLCRAVLSGIQGEVASCIEASQQAKTFLTQQDTYAHKVLRISLGIAYILHGQFEQADACFLPDNQAENCIEDIQLSLYSLGCRAFILMEKGRLHQALDLYQQVLFIGKVEKDRFPKAKCLALLGKGELLYRWHQLDQATQTLQQGIELAQKHQYYTLHAHCLLSLAHVYATQEQTDTASELLVQAEQLARSYHLHNILALVQARQAELSLNTRNHADAIDWMQAAHVSPHDSLTYMNEEIYLVYAQILEETDKLEEARILLSRLKEKACAEKREKNIITVLVRLSIVLEKQEKMSAALSTFLHALSSAEEIGILSPFVETGKKTKRLLLLAQQELETDITCSPSLERYLNTLRRMFKPQTSTSAPAPMYERQTILSRREHDILTLLAEGLSNQQIAERLIVAETTTKWYLKVIYRKLDVSSRLQAIIRAKELKVI